MTMQVAMVGDGGIVIASDRKVFRSCNPTTNLIGEAADQRVLECKIEFSSEKNIAISCAQDLQHARNVAREIIEELTDADRDNEYSAVAAIEKIAEKALGEGNNSSVRCLIALKCPGWHLFTYTSENSQGECEAHTIGWEVAGHVTNPAIFLARYHSEDYSVDQLIPLASYLVLCAHHFNSLQIEGLDVVRCDQHGVRRLCRSAIQQLEKRKWDDSIRHLFVNYNGQYSYIPSAPALP